MDQRYVVSGPIVEVGIENNTPVGYKLMLARLASLASADPSFEFSPDPAVTVLKAQSENQLDAIVRDLRAQALEITIGAPQVSYRECIVRLVEVDYTHKRQTGGTGEFARVWLRLEPGDPNADATFVSNAGDTVPREFLPGVIEALAAFKQSGLLAGYPLIGFKATLLDGAYHEVDSSLAAFKTATRSALQVINERGAIALLEPVMALNVTISNEFHDAVVRDLSARAGQVDAGNFEINALVPLAGVLGYRGRLAQVTEGKGTFVMRYSHHAIASHPDGPDRFGPAAAVRLRA